MRTISLKSPAKINLWLQVIGKNQDNYHDLYTILQLIDLCDQITLTEIDTGIRIISNANIPTDNNNLAYKAANILMDKYPFSKGIEINIEKHIPIAAGLGGGSSNAASILIGLNKLFALNISHEKMHKIGRSIGSDIPFFLSGYTAAVGKERGDILEEIDINDDFCLLLVNPKIEVSTAWAYNNLSLTKPVYDYKIKEFMSKVSLNEILPILRNDLEKVVIGRHPIIEKIKGRLIELGARGAAMSGSGSTIFGLFNDYNSASSAFKKWNYPDCDLFIAKPIRSILDIHLF